jgi:hypothetical protein
MGAKAHAKLMDLAKELAARETGLDQGRGAVLFGQKATEVLQPMGQAVQEPLQVETQVDGARSGDAACPPGGKAVVFAGLLVIVD